MKNNITELVFIIDKSGSMEGFESDTIGGFNSMLKEQKERSGEVYVTTVLFDTRVSTLHDRLEISEIKPVTRREYKAGGCTALYDAVGSTIEHISKIHKYIKKEDVPEKTLFVITTDGMENASSIYKKAQIKAMIEEKRTQGWEFVFLAANIDVEETAVGIGIDRSRARKYDQSTPCCYEAEYSRVSRMVSHVRERKSLDTFDMND